MDGKLKVYTLGEFKVEYEGELISPKEQINSKPWLFFKYLITERDKNLHSEVISSDLWPKKEIKNPKHSITNLVYRLRKKLRFIEEDKKTNYIINANGSCFFNKDSNYWLDIDEFIELSKKADRIKDREPKKAIALYQKAIDLYKGDYLPEIPYQDWVIPHRNNYHWNFVETVLEYIELLKQEGKLEKVIPVCTDALDKEFYEEELHIHYLDALLKLGEHAHARSHYEYAKEFLNNNLDISNLPELQFLEEKNHKSNNKAIDKIQKQLKNRNNIKGAFTCKSDIFRMIYELEERRNERYNKPVFVSYLKFKNNNILEKNDYVIENILKKELRKGDVITRWDDNKYLMLLLDMSKSDVIRVLNRVISSIQDSLKIAKETIKYNYKTI